MKKINSIQQLLAEKERLKQQQKDLEKSIVHNWEELKLQLRPANLAKDAISSAIHNMLYNKRNNGSLFKNTIREAISFLANKVKHKADEKAD